MIAAQAFKESVENPSNTVACLFDKEREKRIKENHQIVKSITRAVLFCGHQCIALRGHREKLDQSENPGNFLALLSKFFQKAIQLWQHIYRLRLLVGSPISPQSPRMR